MNMNHYLVVVITLQHEDSKEATYFVKAESLEDAGKLAIMLESPNPDGLLEDGCQLVESDKSCSYTVDSVELVDAQDVPVLSKYIMPLSSKAVVSPEAHRYWDTPECPECGEKAEEPFLEKGETFRYRCSNGHSVLYIRDVEEDQIDPYAPSAWG